MATVAELDAQIAAAQAQLAALKSNNVGTTAPSRKGSGSLQATVPGGMAGRPVARTATNMTMPDNSSVLAYLNQNKGTNNILQALISKGMGQTGQGQLGYNPITGAAIRGGDFSKAPIQRMFGSSTNEPNWADKLAFLAGGRVWQNQPGQAPVDPYAGVPTEAQLNADPMYGATFEPTWNYPTVDMSGGVGDWIPTDWATDLTAGMPTSF